MTHLVCVEHGKRSNVAQYADGESKILHKRSHNGTRVCDGELVSIAKIRYNKGKVNNSSVFYLLRTVLEEEETARKFRRFK